MKVFVPAMPVATGLDELFQTLAAASSAADVSTQLLWAQRALGLFFAGYAPCLCVRGGEAELSLRMGEGAFVEHPVPVALRRQVAEAALKAIRTAGCREFPHVAFIPVHGTEDAWREILSAPEEEKAS